MQNVWPHYFDMHWLFRRILMPVCLGTMVGAVLLVIFIYTGPDKPEGIFHWSFFVMTALLVAPFEASGLVLFLPIALLLCDIPMPRFLRIILITVTGSILGTIVTLPITDGPITIHLVLSAFCGAASSVIWYALNSDAVTR
jgi:hypothetical protein